MNAQVAAHTGLLFRSRAASAQRRNAERPDAKDAQLVAKYTALADRAARVERDGIEPAR